MAEDIVAGDENRVAQARKLAGICYALYAASFFVGITAIAALIVDYLKREDAAGTWVASHFEWQIKTFWYSVAGMIVGGLLMIVGIGFLLIGAVALWALYRLVKGWLALNDGKPVDASKLI